MLDRLRLRRVAVERELDALPAPPKSTRDVFALCRGFERAFGATVDSTEYAAHIRNAFQEGGLAGAIRRLPLEAGFRLDVVKATVRETDGFQPHLVSPEAGLRRLVGDALTLVGDPVAACVHRIHTVLLAAAREAATKASLMADAGSSSTAGREPLRLPAFEAAVITAATRALEGWRDEALQVAATVVAMERSYVTAAFFRQRAIDRAAAGGGGGDMGDSGAVGYGSDSDDDSGGSPGGARPLRLPGLGLGAPPTAAAAASGQLKSGYLEKRIGEHSTRQSLPDAFRWQRRYFVLTEPKGVREVHMRACSSVLAWSRALHNAAPPKTKPSHVSHPTPFHSPHHPTTGLLYYFKSPDDPPNYKGVIQIRECRIEDLEADGTPRQGGGPPSAERGRFDLDGGGGGAAAGASSSLLFRIANKDPTKPLIKNHASIVLRAETASDKYSWLARLRAAAAAPPEAGGPAPTAPLAAGAAAAAARRRPSEGADGGTPPARRGAPPGPSPPPPPRSGIGAAIGWSTDSRLGPEPTYGCAQDYDSFLARLGEDTAAYVRTVSATVAVTVPKAVVHCQVKRAQGHLLEALYAHISGLPSECAAALTVEEGDAAVRRAAAQRAAGELADALKAASLAREGAAAAGSATASVPRFVVALAGEGAAAAGAPAPPPPAPPSPSTNGNGQSFGRPSLALPGAAAPGQTSPSPVPRRRPPPAPPA